MVQRKTIKEIATSPGAIVLVLFLLIGIIFQSYLQENLEKIRTLISYVGIFGPLTFIFLLILGIVFAPINGFLIWLVGFYIFGLERTIIYASIGGWVGGSMAFFIARKLGRPIVVKLIGKKEMVRVDRLTDKLGIKALIILRVFCGIFFDVVSYAAGLTSIPYRQFLIITILGPVPSTILIYLLIKNTQNIITILTGSAIVSYIGFSIGFILLLLLHKREDGGFWRS